MKEKGSSLTTKEMVFGAILTALVVILQLMGAFVRLGPFSVSLVLVPIVIGAAICSVKVGAWLGFVFGFVVLLLPGTSAFLSLSPVGTVITVILKGALAGVAAAFIYKLLEARNRYVASLVSAVVATFVNTGVFIIGSLIFFESDISIIINVFVSLNFLIELAVNTVLVPTIYRIINIKGSPLRTADKSVNEKEI